MNLIKKRKSMLDELGKFNANLMPYDKGKAIKAESIRQYMKQARIKSEPDSIMEEVRLNAINFRVLLDSFLVCQHIKNKNQLSSAICELNTEIQKIRKDCQAVKNEKENQEESAKEKQREIDEALLILSNIQKRKGCSSVRMLT